MSEIWVLVSKFIRFKSIFPFKHWADWFAFSNLKSCISSQSRSYFNSNNCKWKIDKLHPHSPKCTFFMNQKEFGWTCQRQGLRYSLYRGSTEAWSIKLSTVLCGDEVCNVTSDRIQFCERVKFFIGSNRYSAADCVTMNWWDVGEEGLRWSLNFHLFIAVTCTNLTAGESRQLFRSQSQ